MTTTKTTKTPAKRGMSNTSDQNYSADVVTTPLVTPETVTTVSATKRTRKVATPVAEVTSETSATPVKRTRATVKRDAETVAETQVAEVATPKTTRAKKTAPKLPEDATEIDTATYLAMTVAGVSGVPSVIASEVDYTLPRVRASLVKLVAWGLVEKTVETLTVGGRSREVESYYLPGKSPKVTGPREITAEEISKTAKTVAKTSAPTPRKRAESAPVTTSRTAPRATVSAPQTPKGRTTRTAPATPEKTSARPPRAPQTRPFVDGEVRTQRVNGRDHVIGTPLNQDRARHTPGGLQGEITTFLQSRAGEWFTVSELARGINNWPAQTGRTATRLVELGILEFANEGRKMFRFPAPVQVKRSARRK